MALSAFAANFNPVLTTSMEALSYGTEDPTGLFIEGFTPDSKEWAAAVKKIQGAPKDQRLHMVKGGSYIEIKADKKETPDADLILVESITNAYQMEDGKPVDLSAADLSTLKSNMLGEWSDLLRQWRDHLDDRKNFLAQPEVKRKSGSKA